MVPGWRLVFNHCSDWPLIACYKDLILTREPLVCRLIICRATSWLVLIWLEPLGVWVQRFNSSADGVCTTFHVQFMHTKISWISYTAKKKAQKIKCTNKHTWQCDSAPKQLFYEYQCGNTLLSNRLQLVNVSELISQHVIYRTDLVTAIRLGYYTADFLESGSL